MRLRLKVYDYNQRGIMRNETRRRLSILMLAAMLVAASSCSMTKGKGIAEAAVAQFHNQYNAGQFHEIYTQTDEGFKKATTEEQLTTLLEALRKKLGTVKQAE